MTSKLNFARVIFMLLSVSLLATNCKDMKLDSQDSKDRLDVLEGTTITSINEQIVAINTSISDLKEMDAALDGYIKTLEATAADLQKQINEANAEIAKVESELGKEISALEQSLLNELNTAKKAIEAELTAINATLVELKTADDVLDKKIEDLQTYVDSQLASTTDWANATFSTLTQYAETQAEIATIKASIEQTNASLAALETRLNGKIADDIKTAIDALRSELNTDYVSKIENAVTSVTSAYNSAISSAKEELTTAYKSAIATAIAESEAGMKAWVNEQLTQSYYDIATIDGMLSALSSTLDGADKDLWGQINEQKDALQQAKNELSSSCRTAISSAIEENNGVINDAIAAQVKAVQGKLQALIDVIYNEIDNLKDRVGKLEIDFVNRIQSLKYIPEYSNHIALISDVTKTFSVDFLVTPVVQANLLAAEWKKNNEILQAYIHYTKVPVTKAGVHATPLLVSSVSASDDGLLTVVLQEDTSSPLSKEFWIGEKSAVMYLYVSDGNTEFISDLVDLEMFDDKFDLSSSQTANCYIVSEAGDYKFPPTKGNSHEKVGAIASAEVLWESFGTDVTPNVGDLVKNVKYEGDVISFETPSTYREGNAVIAAKDASGNILWSWHIWLTDQPNEQVYYYKAGSLMDRNLGATSATPGDVGALGLLYQWGRKDPFLSSSSLSDNIVAKSTIIWPLEVGSDSSTGTIEYATANPTTYIGFVHVTGCNEMDKNYDWYYTGSSLTDNTRWTNGVKSIYDPCPAGWRVPDGGDNGTWCKVGSGYYDCDLTNMGVNLTRIFGSDSVIWYPAGCYWSASYYSHDVRGASILVINLYDSYLGGQSSTCREYALSVRCQKE